MSVLDILTDQDIKDIRRDISAAQSYGQSMSNYINRTLRGEIIEPNLKTLHLDLQQLRALLARAERIFYSADPATGQEAGQ